MRLLHYSKRQSGRAQFLAVAASALLLIGCSSTPIKSVDNQKSTPASRLTANSAPVLPPAGSGRGGYYQDDGPGEKPPEDLEAIPDAEPKVEPYSARGNRPYVVFGKTYKPITDNNPFIQRGIGSWYGKKFHGQKTSSGELYDMYKMTAAHPTLPLPSYARVTNIRNGQQVIVRVNDRGPFLASRIVDLSYTAAWKLGYLSAGSSELEVERILPDDIARIVAEQQQKQSVLQPLEPAPPAAPASSSQAAAEAMLRNDANPIPASAALGQPALALMAADSATNPAANSADLPATITVSESTTASQAVIAGGYYLQVGAYSQFERAELRRAQFQQQWTGSLPTLEVVQNGALYRLFCGPFSSREDATAAAQKIRDNSAAKPLIVQR